MRLLYSVLLTLATLSAFAQDPKFAVSEPVDISQSGYDRLVQLKNGHTMLFHFENRKGIIVKVFNQEHKEIASYKELCKVIDINTLNAATLKGVVDVNDDAVLFVEQDIDNRKTLVRLRFNSLTGKLISEDKLVRSESFNKPTSTMLLKNQMDGRYYIITVKETKGFVEKQMSLTIYNDKHEVEKTIPIDVDQKGYDHVSLRNITLDSRGGLIGSVILSKIVKYPLTNESIMAVCYLTPGGDQFIYKKAQLPQVSDLDMNSTFNPFTGSLNVLLTMHFLGEVKNAKGASLAGLSEQMLMIIDEGATSLKFNSIANDKVRQYIAKEIDTNQFFSGSLMDMHTSRNGLTTLVYTGYTKHATNIGMTGVTGFRNNIAFTQLDDNGKELFGIAVPTSQLKTFNDYPSVFYRNSETNLCRQTCFNSKDNFYVAFNEVEKNFTLKLAQQHDSIYNVEFTNAAYYKLNKKKEITKGYLLGQPVAGEYKNIYPGSACFDERTNTQAIMYRHVKGEKHTMHIAWVNVD